MTLGRYLLKERFSLYFVVLNLIDYMLTRVLIETGMGSELNLVWHMFPLEMKLVLSVIIAFFVRRRNLMEVVCLGMAFIVVWNALWFELGANV